MIKEFIDLLRRFENNKNNDDQKGLIGEEKEKFENDFVALNCEIQQIRSDNETLLDELKIREEHLQNVDKAIQEKASLIQVLEDRINELTIDYDKSRN